jgi:hypothetical protein
MVPIKTLLPELHKLLGELNEDLLSRSIADSQIDSGLKEAFHQIEKGGRTGQAFEVWREDYLDQVAVAWVLACVFVRFMEDNDLIDECWLGGEGERRTLADDTYQLFFREYPHDTDREYFQHVFKEVGKIPAAKDLFAEGKTPLWAVPPSGDAARMLRKFWQEIVPETGHLKRSFKVENGDTRFLGDLYQELSKRAKKKFALLQTPVFVEEFILDRTLTPAIAEFGLENVRMIDPTCGSGHFLLGGFARLFDLWSKPDYTTGNAVTDAQKSLDGVWGVDINPFAVAIARFRLIVTAVQACGIKRLKQAPGWNIHLATGDSLLFGSRWSTDGTKRPETRYLDDSWAPEIYACEDKELVNEILGQKYHVVVGNPPYIIVRDRRLNAAYRERYSTCHQKFSLGVPFTERFWELALQRDQSGNSGCGYIGMITTNSFMKREFGKKLIEEFFPKVDLSHIVDTSSANIPGHTTSTVILFGRNRPPVEPTVRAILGIKGEANTPEDASKGKVWLSIVDSIDKLGAEDEYISTADMPRTTLSSHPWSIGGGGAADLKEQIEEACSITLGELATSIGFASFPGQDDVFALDASTCKRLDFDASVVKPLVYGEAIREWTVNSDRASLVPYDSDFRLLEFDADTGWCKYLWAYRTCLEGVVSFGGQTRKALGAKWWGWYRWIPEKYRNPLSIAFAEVATHNHFVIEKHGVFNQTAPVVKLKADLSEEEHFGVLSALNSSVVCFWLMQVCQCKGDGERGMEAERWFRSFQFNSTKVGMVPLPDQWPSGLAQRIIRLQQARSRLSPFVTINDGRITSDQMRQHSEEAASILRQMICLHEELDWHCYHHYGILSDDLGYTGDDLPELPLGQRAFEIVMARQIAKGKLDTKWFERHGSTPITSIPSHWPAAYRTLVERRIKLIEAHKELALIEKPEYKRRWNCEPWQEQEKQAIKNWLLDRLESPRYRKGTNESSEVTTTAQMTDVASADAEFLQVATLYRSRPDFDVASLIAELVEGEAVPFLPVLRYKISGLRKREVWERTWDLQRQEDAGKQVGEIPVPPKYATADFVRSNYWRLRGKLDVPKERWISYPHCSTESDPTLVVGWAGWNHLEQATALVAYYDARKRDGWDAKRLTLLLAGLDQLLPWIHQWHTEIDPEFGETAGQSFQTMLEHDAHELGLTLEDIRNWTPPAKVGRSRATRKKMPAEEVEAQE